MKASAVSGPNGPLTTQAPKVPPIMAGTQHATATLRGMSKTVELVTPMSMPNRR